MKKKILIVGSQGAISKNLLNYNVFEKEKILLLSRYKHKNFKTFTYTFPDINFDQSIFSNVETVIFLAGHSDNQDKYKLNLLNVEYPIFILNKAIKVLDKVNFIYLSSSKVNIKIQNLPEQNYIDSKKEAEIKLFELQRKYRNKINLLILRPSAVYDVNMKNNIYFFVKYSISPFSLGIPKIKNKRGILHLRNLLQVIQNFTKKPKNYENPITLTDQRHYSIYEMYDLARTIFERPLPKIKISIIIFKILATLGDKLFFIGSNFNSEKYSKMFNDEYFQNNAPLELINSKEYNFENYLSKLKIFCEGLRNVWK